MTNVFIKRQIYDDLLSHLESKKITVITGPRQSGKTTLLKNLQKVLGKKRRLTLYYNLDILRDFQVVENQTNFIKLLNQKTRSGFVYVFIDEIQRLNNPGIFLKGIYDSGLPVKLIATGSASLEIKTKIAEPLTGRKRLFHLFPLSFDEFLKFKRPDINELKAIPQVHYQEYVYLLDEYSKFGGYPEVVLKQNEEEKINVLEELYSSYIEKDIKGFFKVKNESSFLTLVSLLASQIGSLLNINLLAANTGSTRTTMNSFLYYLEQSFIIHRIRPFFRNPKKEILKNPKVYFADIGLRNMIVKNFAPLLERSDRGKVFENMVCSKLLSELDQTDKLFHWRTKTKAEVDFVVQKGEKLIPLEVKAQNLSRLKVSRSFRSFLSAYKPENGLIVNFSGKDKIKIGRTDVCLTPFSDINC